MTGASSTITNFQIITGSIALYNCLELCIMIAHRFKRYRSLYFMSMAGSTAGTIAFTLGFYSLFFEYYTSIYQPLFILTVGWYAMVTGFSLILYSRLHIVQADYRIRRGVAMMIICNVIFNHFPTTVLTFGSNVVKSHPFVYGYSVMEKIQMTFFWLQETILSSIYMYYTYHILINLEKQTTTVKAKRQIFNAVWINFFVLILDFAALVFEYCDMYDYQIMFKAVLYSIKIKCEFIILNQLKDMLLNNTTIPHHRSRSHAWEKSAKPIIVPTSSTGGEKTASGDGNNTVHVTVERVTSTPVEPFQRLKRQSDSFQSQDKEMDVSAIPPRLSTDLLVLLPISSNDGDHHSDPTDIQISRA